MWRGRDTASRNSTLQQEMVEGIVATLQGYVVVYSFTWVREKVC
jgi:hypothetical protein